MGVKFYCIIYEHKHISLNHSKMPVDVFHDRVFIVNRSDRPVLVCLSAEHIYERYAEGCTPESVLAEVETADAVESRILSSGSSCDICIGALRHAYITVLCLDTNSKPIVSGECGTLLVRCHNQVVESGCKLVVHEDNDTYYVGACL